MIFRYHGLQASPAEDAERARELRHRDAGLFTAFPRHTTEQLWHFRPEAFFRTDPAQTQDEDQGRRGWATVRQRMLMEEVYQSSITCSFKLIHIHSRGRER